MKITPRTLLVIAANAVALPTIAMFISQLLVWAIPGCDPSPYATDGCNLLGIELDVPQVLGLMGCWYLALSMAVFVSVPLIVSATVWHLIRRNSTGKVA